MGNIPQQVLKAAEAEEREIDALAQAAQNQSHDAQVQNVAQSSAQQPAAQTAQAIDSGESLLSSLGSGDSGDAVDIQRAKSTLGRAKKLNAEAEEKMAKFEAKEREYQDKIHELEEQLAEAESCRAKGNYNDDEDDVLLALNGDNDGEDAPYTAEQAKAFSKSVRASLKKELAALEEFKQSKVKATQHAFVQELERAFPGFVSLDSNRDSRWMNFLATHLPSPMDEFTYEQVAREAIKSCDTRKMAGVIRAFSNATGVRFSSNGVSPIGWEQVRPQNVAGSHATTQNESKPVFARSLVNQFRKAYFAKRYADFGMDKQKASQVLQQMEEAEAMGRIDERK